MPTQKADVGNDFSTVLSRAQERPAGEQVGRDLVDGFPFAPPPNHQVVDSADENPRAIPGTVKYPFKVHRQVFTLWRDWNACFRCKDNLSANKIALPEDGDYECPHNNKDQYEKVCNEILAGELLMGSEQEVVQRDGMIVISLRWFERVLTKKERRAIIKSDAVAKRTDEW